MDHRWGLRYLLDMPVRLERLPNLVAFARLRNVSASGAYIETSAAPALDCRILLELGCRADAGGERCRVPAHVVRRDERGVGIEWCEFAPRPVLTLIAAGWQAEVSRAGQVRSVSQALTPVRNTKPALPLQAFR